MAFFEYVQLVFRSRFRRSLTSIIRISNCPNSLVSFERVERFSRLHLSFRHSKGSCERSRESSEE